MEIEEINKKLRMVLGQAELEGGETLLGVIRSLDEYLEGHRGELPKKLAHFLEKRSYEKALLFLEGKEVDG